jgi:hypothetical protein
VLDLNPAFIGAFSLLVCTTLLIPAIWRMRNGPNTNPLHRRRNWKD